MSDFPMSDSSKPSASPGMVALRESPSSAPSPWAPVPVASHGDVVAEYAALRRDAAHGSGGAVVVDFTARSRGTFAGAKAPEVLAGLVTNDVLSLVPGTGCYAAALTPKGKIIADPRIYVRSDDVVVDVPARAGSGWWGMVRKYVNPRLAKYADISADTAQLAVFGERAHAVVAAALGVGWEAIAGMEMHGHQALTLSSHAVLLARLPDLAVAGFSLIVPRETREALWDALVGTGARPVGMDAYHIARMENGRPEWGIEIDDSTLAQEANMDDLGAISYTKGCYTGQETVARVHFRGRVNRMLRGLRFDESQAIAIGAVLRDASGKEVGDVRSMAISPRLGGIALAMVRREVEPDSEVVVGNAGHGVPARVIALPFPSG